MVKLWSDLGDYNYLDDAVGNVFKLRANHGHHNVVFARHFIIECFVKATRHLTRLIKDTINDVL